MKTKNSALLFVDQTKFSVESTGVRPHILNHTEERGRCLLFASRERVLNSFPVLRRHGEADEEVRESHDDVHHVQQLDNACSNTSDGLL